MDEPQGQTYHYVRAGTRLALSWKQYDARREVLVPGPGGMSAPKAIRLIERVGNDYIVEVMGKDAVGFKAGETYRVVV